MGWPMATYTRFSVGAVGFDVEHLPCLWDARLVLPSSGVWEKGRPTYFLASCR